MTERPAPRTTGRRKKRPAERRTGGSETRPDTRAASAVAGTDVRVDLGEHLFFLFGQVYGKRNRDLAQLLRPWGLTNAKYRALAALTDRDGSTIWELADLTAVERTTLSRALDQLEASGLVARRPRAGNRRIVEVWLTGPGRTLIGEVWQEIVVQNERAVAGLSEREIANLKRILHKMIANVRGD